MPQAVPMTYCAKCVHLECDAGPGADPYRARNRCAAPARDEAERDRRRPKLQGHMPLSATHDCDSFEAITAQVAEVQTLPESKNAPEIAGRNSARSKACGDHLGSLMCKYQDLKRWQPVWDAYRKVVDPFDEGPLPF